MQSITKKDRSFIVESRSVVAVFHMNWRTSLYKLLEGMWTYQSRRSGAETPLYTKAEVVVSANRRVQAVQDVPITVSVLSAEDLDQRSITRLDDALRYVNGIVVARDQVNIRGTSGFALGVGSRAAVLLDGFSLLSGDNGDIKFDVLPVSDIERIEIVKGAGSALYGTGALGGVIQLITKDPGDSLTVYSRLYGGLYTDRPFQQWQYSSSPSSQWGGDVRLAQRIGDGPEVCAAR